MSAVLRDVANFAPEPERVAAAAAAAEAAAAEARVDREVTPQV
jgi:hypothetical protein